MRADTLAIHPHAQRDLVPSKLKKLLSNFDLDAIGVLHAVEYPINGVSKVWVIDGQHRLRALLDHGFGEWQVEVKIHTEATDDVRAAQLFLKLNDRASVMPYDKFVNEAKANNPDALGVLAITNRHGLEIAKANADGKLTCVSTLKSLYKVDQGKTLNFVLGLIKEAWGTKSTALEGKLIEGIGAVVARYRESIDRDSLVNKLSKYPGGASGLVGDAKGMNQYRRTTLSKCVAERVIETYNTGRRSGKLDPMQFIEAA